jgi:hypothetical protein
MILKKQGEFVTEYFVFRKLGGLLRICCQREKTGPPHSFWPCLSKGKDIVFRFIIECSSLRDFGP